MGRVRAPPGHPAAGEQVGGEVTGEVSPDSPVAGVRPVVTGQLTQVARPLSGRAIVLLRREAIQPLRSDTDELNSDIGEPKTAQDGER